MTKGLREMMFRLILALLVFLLTLLELVSTTRHGGHHKQEWIEFKSAFNKTYISLEEEMKRWAVFNENHWKIRRHNMAADRGDHSFWLKINHMADMTSEEIDSMMKGLHAHVNLTSESSLFYEPYKLPESIDWRTKGYVTPVKFQGHCGGCYAFSATGALEGQHFRKTGRLVSLSEQNIIDCTSNWKYHDRGCHGGLMDRAFRYIADNGGVDTEESYPYEAEVGPCRFKRTNIGATATNYFDILPRGDEKVMKLVVGLKGPVSVGIDARGYLFHFYSHGVFDNLGCSSRKLDHAMLVVGYGTDEDNRDFWIVKNSWGRGWGMDGYIRMIRNRGNQCGIASLASLPIV